LLAELRDRAFQQVISAGNGMIDLPPQLIEFDYMHAASLQAARQDNDDAN
jgi:hypothetical protein